uniref:SH2 domain-containing protein n=1 Tax=Rhabditophanes sp. KR3021 TaxID=114890 RepID=A0AC35U0I2_9BILA
MGERYLNVIEPSQNNDSESDYETVGSVDLSTESSHKRGNIKCVASDDKRAKGKDKCTNDNPYLDLSKRKSQAEVEKKFPPIRCPNKLEPCNSFVDEPYALYSGILRQRQVVKGLTSHDGPCFTFYHRLSPRSLLINFERQLKLWVAYKNETDYTYHEEVIFVEKTSKKDSFYKVKDRDGKYRIFDTFEELIHYYQSGFKECC